MSKPEEATATVEVTATPARKSKTKTKTPRKHVKAAHLRKLEESAKKSKAKVERHLYPDTANIKSSDTQQLNDLADRILGSNNMTNSTLWVDLRGDIRKVIAGGYDRSSLDKQVKLTRVKYDQLTSEERVQKQKVPAVVVDSTTMSADKVTTGHAEDVADLEESSSSVPTDRSQAVEKKITHAPVLKPWAGFDPRGVSPVPRNLPPLPLEKTKRTVESTITYPTHSGRPEEYTEQYT